MQMNIGCMRSKGASPRRQVIPASVFHSEHSGTIPLNSISSHCCCSQRRMAAGIIGQGFERPLPIFSQAVFAGSSEDQPSGANSTIAPSRCFHLKAKYISISSTKSLF